MRRPKPLRWSLSFVREDTIAVRKLIRELWLIGDSLEWHQVKAYQEHIKECRKAKDDDSIPCAKVADVLKLVDQVKASKHLQVSQIYGRIRAAYSTNQQQQEPIHDASIHQAFSFAVRLWLFLPLTTELRQTSSRTLETTVQDVTSRFSSPSPDNRTLKEDFCEKSLTRKAGIKLRWTSDLTRHLELRENRLFVFRHGAALKVMAGDSEISALFPGTFLVETQSTIDLLFPVALEPLSTRRRHISTKHHVDLEVGDLGTETGEPARELSAYAYWGARLAAVDDRYQSSNPQRLKQWYYDRRDKKSWTTFWFAMTAFVLAVIFGLISSVTAVMQTWKAYHR